jgi:hypothetical protein
MTKECSHPNGEQNNDAEPPLSLISVHLYDLFGLLNRGI